MSRAPVLFPGCGADGYPWERGRIGWDISFPSPQGGITGPEWLGFCPDWEGREGFESLLWG